MEVLRETVELKRVGTQSAREAQAENRRLGIPNVYSQNGTLYFELPDGTITQEDPFVDGNVEQSSAG
jgi:CMP-N-acetylneuraminic acid synthetase